MVPFKFAALAVLLAYLQLSFVAAATDCKSFLSETSCATDQTCQWQLGKCIAKASVE